MFKIKEFEKIYTLLNLNEKKRAQEILISLRTRLALHPDYLFLMSLYLKEDKRYYLSIDSSLLSIKIDNDFEFLKKRNFTKSSDELVKQRYLLLIDLFKEINIPELLQLTNFTLESNDHLKFIKHINQIMPGIRLKLK
jgi:hypothetical protein